MSINKDTRVCVSGQERHKAHSVFFTGSGKSLISTPCISKTSYLVDFHQFYVFCAFHNYSYMTLHMKFERNCISSVQDILS